MREIHELDQGSEAWHAHRAKYLNASEAAAMLGISQYQTRGDLLRQKATGWVPEVDAATQRRFDDGHAAEAAARPIAEGIVGADLYPITATLYVDGLPLSASYDGATMEEDIIFEHKLANKELKASLAEGIIPNQYLPQLEQQLLILGAEKCLFMASNGDGQLHAWYESDPAMRATLIAGWKQFAEDLANYAPPEVIPAAVAAPQASLPAVAVTVTGSIAIRDNLTVFGDALTTYVERINRKPETDQDFADLEATAKALKTAEEALDAAENNALAQTGDLDALRRTISQYRDLARQNRLMVEKLVKAEKENRRNAIMQGGVTALRAHVDALNKRLGKPYMPDTQWANFPAAMKGLKTMASLQNAVDTELAQAKINSSACADRIEINLKGLSAFCGDTDYGFLFRDLPSLVLKAPDDFAAAVTLRINEHKVAEEKRLEAERAKIRAEEEAKAAAKQNTQPEPAKTPANEGTGATPAGGAAKPQMVQAAATVRLPTGRPTDDEIIAAVALAFRVHESKAIEWLLDVDLNAASDRMVKEFAA